MAKIFEFDSFVIIVPKLQNDTHYRKSPQKSGQNNVSTGNSYTNVVEWCRKFRKEAESIKDLDVYVLAEFLYFVEQWDHWLSVNGDFF